MAEGQGEIRLVKGVQTTEKNSCVIVEDDEGYKFGVIDPMVEFFLMVEERISILTLTGNIRLTVNRNEGAAPTTYEDVEEGQTFILKAGSSVRIWNSGEKRSSFFIRRL